MGLKRIKNNEAHKIYSKAGLGCLKEMLYKGIDNQSMAPTINLGVIINLKLRRDATHIQQCCYTKL